MLMETRNVVLWCRVVVILTPQYNASYYLNMFYIGWTSPVFAPWHTIINNIRIDQVGKWVLLYTYDYSMYLKRGLHFFSLFIYSYGLTTDQHCSKFDLIKLWRYIIEQHEYISKNNNYGNDDKKTKTISRKMYIVY